MTFDIRDAHGTIISIETPLAPGRVAAADSRPVVLSTEDLARLDTIIAAGASVSTASVTSLASSAASQQLLAANPARKGLILHNSDANAVYVKYGTTASTTSYTVLIPAGGYWEMPRPTYTGRVDAIWAADGAGSLLATEL